MIKTIETWWFKVSVFKTKTTNKSMVQCFHPLVKSPIRQFQADQMAKLTVTLETEPGLTMSEYWSPLQVRQCFGPSFCCYCWGKNTKNMGNEWKWWDMIGNDGNWCEMMGNDGKWWDNDRIWWDWWNCFHPFSVFLEIVVWKNLFFFTVSLGWTEISPPTRGIIFEFVPQGLGCLTLKWSLYDYQHLF